MTRRGRWCGGRALALAAACALAGLPALPDGLSAQLLGGVASMSGIDRDLRVSLDGDEQLFEARIVDRGLDAMATLVPNHEGRYIVVHLEENYVYVFDGGRAIWSSPSGTGTGTRLQTGEYDWDFATPRGLFKVRVMERDPVWEAPAWHWIERGQTPPPPSRRFIQGGLGNTALFLGHGIAIHGTPYPELLLNPDPEARRVSHGCIRLTNEAARELMELVEVGTPVLIF